MQTVVRIKTLSFIATIFYDSPKESANVLEVFGMFRTGLGGSGGGVLGGFGFVGGENIRTFAVHKK